MIVKRLKYSTKEEAINDLEDKGVINNENNYLDNTLAVVYLDKIIDTQGTYDEESGDVITPPTFKDGYHVDLMLREDIEFGANEINPNTPKHNFL